MEGTPYRPLPVFTACRGTTRKPPLKMVMRKKPNKIPEEAGWKLNKDGLREKDGKVAKLTLWYTSGDTTRRDLCIRLSAPS